MNRKKEELQISSKPPIRADYQQRLDLIELAYWGAIRARDSVESIRLMTEYARLSKHVAEYPDGERQEDLEKKAFSKLFGMIKEEIEQALNDHNIDQSNLRMIRNGFNLLIVLVDETTQKSYLSTTIEVEKLIPTLLDKEYEPSIEKMVAYVVWHAIDEGLKDRK